MKKATEWVRKNLKRGQKKKDRGIVDFMMITRHFFKDTSQWIGEMEDPRHPSYTVYTQQDLVHMGILKNVCAQLGMRQMEENFNEENCIRTLRLLSGNKELAQMPHYDTLNYYLERLPPKCLSELRGKMINHLIRGKYFSRGRLLGKYWRVILDGTGLFCFKEKHCPDCLGTTKTMEDGKKIKLYYHKVLEAKIVFADKIIVSLGTEFIENESGNASKQDCETNAAKRLLKRIKKEHPRLPLCIQGDALYAAEPMMELCRKNGWKYIFTQKDTRQKQVGEAYEWIKRGNGAACVKGICEEKGTGRYANDVDEVAGKTQDINCFEYQYTYEDKKTGSQREASFEWITDIEVNERNIEELVKAGRGRWKIENEGFNSQKNGIYRIEHLNSRNTNAMKNHYLLTQTADILMQIYLAWNPLVKKIKQSIKNTSSRLLESFRRQTVTDEDVSYIARYTTVYLE